MPTKATPTPTADIDKELERINILIEREMIHPFDLAGKLYDLGKKYQLIHLTRVANKIMKELDLSFEGKADEHYKIGHKVASKGFTELDKDRSKCAKDGCNKLGTMSHYGSRTLYCSEHFFT